MRSLKTSLMLFLVAVMVAAIAIATYVNPPAEAPSGFDGLSNGMVDHATHDFDAGQFSEVEQIDDGLGPLYNAQSCRECHQNPTTGGISQVTELRVGHRDARGRFVAPTVYAADGSVLTVGRSLINDRATCPEIQERVPDTETIRTFRTSLNVLGDGFVEAVADETFLEIAERQRRQSNGAIQGQAIYVDVLEAPGRKRLGRFGWKNQHASLLSFSSDAYLNEMGFTNPLALTEVVDRCNTVPQLNDKKGQDGLFDTDHFTRFMRASKVPPRDPQLAPMLEARLGEELFRSVGCATCHVPAMVTAPAGTRINGGMFTVPESLGNKLFHPFSDFLLHDVGTGDGIVQNGGQETANKLRTPPLWGVRTRDRLMHDGRSLTFVDAIQRHGGEASRVIEEFRELSEAEKQRVIFFLRTL